MDPLRIYIAFDPHFPEGADWTRFFVGQFGALGMQRDELRHFVPVQIRSQPWGADQPGLPGNAFPRRIDLSEASRNCILVLSDSRMGFRDQLWATYFNHILAQRRPGRDLVVPLQFGSEAPSFLRDLQSIRMPGTAVPEEGSPLRRRIMVQLLNKLLTSRAAPEQQSAHRPGHGIFVSHAKRDGAGIAKRIVQVLDRVGERLGPNFFFDVDSLLPGDGYPERFEQAIGEGSLLAIVTDTYHARPWCRWEVLTAKRLGRPVIAADLTAGRVERTYPYLGNVLSIRVKPAASSPDEIADDDIEALTLALLSESLRIELWRERALDTLRGRPAHLCARPPELADLAHVAGGVPADGRNLVLYPDPPLGTEETDLLQRAFPGLTLSTPSLLAAQS